MSIREMYEYALIELNKLEAPSLILEDYNYFLNKAIQQYVNLVYAKAEIDQQSTDDIRVLRTSAIIPTTKIAEKSAKGEAAKPTVSEEIEVPSHFGEGLFKTSYVVPLPRDYMHLLNCVVEYQVQTNNFKCYNKGDVVYFAARRLTPEMYSQVLNNAYMRPMYKRPYYYINNYNTAFGLYAPANGLNPATNSIMDDAILKYNNGDEDNNFGTTGTHGDNYTNDKNQYAASNLLDSENMAGDRLSNASSVIMELRFGTDDTVFKPINVYVDYLKSPMYLRLTQEQINSTLDYSQILEFPDYVCFEILNIFVRLLMENSSDPRLQTNIPLNNTIANPLAQQTT